MVLGHLRRTILGIMFFTVLTYIPIAEVSVYFLLCAGSIESVRVLDRCMLDAVVSGLVLVVSAPLAYLKSGQTSKG